jgi:hypothetical protein
VVTPEVRDLVYSGAKFSTECHKLGLGTPTITLHGTDDKISAVIYAMSTWYEPFRFRLTGVREGELGGVRFKW